MNPMTEPRNVTTTFVTILLLAIAGLPMRGQPESPVEELHRIINIERNKLERPMLVYSETLASVAQSHAIDLATSDITGHAGSARLSLKERILRAGRPYLMVAENIAYAKSTPRDAFSEWMLDHKNWAKMFKKEYTEIGIGYAYNSDSKYKFYWVVILGTPKGNPIGK